MFLCITPLNAIKITLQYFICILLLSGCGQQTSQKDSPNTDSKYTLINDDLYTDSSGQLFFKVIDRSTADNPNNPNQGLKIRYIDYLRFDTIISGKKTYITPKISEIVDPETFKENEVPDSLNYRVFKDKNHTYTLISQADGGVLLVIGKCLTCIKDS